MAPILLVELLGWTLVVTGVLDIGLVNMPVQFGNPLWEFGVAAQTVASMVPVLVGIALLWLVAEVRRSKVRLGVNVALGAGAGLAIIGLMLMAALSVPPFMELAGAQEGAGAAARRAVMKTAGLGMIGGLFLMAGTIRSVRRFTSRSAGAHPR